MSDTSKKIKTAVLGASGYTGAEMIRLIAGHPHFELHSVSAHSHAGRKLGEMFPHLMGVGDFNLVTADAIDWSEVDLVFSCLPHGASQDVIEGLPVNVKVVDLSADYRLRDAALYEETYGRSHLNAERTKNAVYGLTEHYREQIKEADLVACPGCYPTATLLALLPLMKAGAVWPEDIIIDAKSGISGAGRGLKEGNLFSEKAEGAKAYSIAAHRHAPEIEQELSQALNLKPVTVNFTPHLLPMARGELVTIYAKLADGQSVESAYEALTEAYNNEAFVRLLPLGSDAPDTKHVRGTNDCRIALYEDRIEGRIVVTAVIDNLVKGSGGQAMQNANLMFGFDEKLGLSGLMPLFP